MNNHAFDFKKILDDFEYRQKLNSISRAICFKFNIAPSSNELVGTLGELNCTNNQQAVQQWVLQQDINLDIQPPDELRQQLFDSFERHWSRY